MFRDPQLKSVGPEPLAPVQWVPPFLTGAPHGRGGDQVSLRDVPPPGPLVLLALIPDLPKPQVPILGAASSAGSLV